MENPLLKKANGFDNPSGPGKVKYNGFYPEAVGGGWNPMKDNKNLSGEYSEQLGGYAAGTRGAEHTKKYIDNLYRGTQEPAAELEDKKPQTGKWMNASVNVKIGQWRSAASPEQSESDRVTAVIWAKAKKAGLLVEKSGRFVLAEPKTAWQRWAKGELTPVVAQVNTRLRRLHIPKNAAAHEAAVIEIAKDMKEK